MLMLQNYPPQPDAIGLFLHGCYAISVLRDYFDCVSRADLIFGRSAYSYGPCGWKRNTRISLSRS